MSPDLERLVRLQQLDTTVEEGRRTIAAHPQRLAEADARLREANERVDTARQRLKESHDARRALEKEAAVFQARVTKFKDQLFEVKTNREYQAVQHEIATAQSELGAVEEKELERMLEADQIAIEIKQAEAALAAQQKQVDAEKTALARELTDTQSALEAATRARAELLAQLEPRLVALYDQVAKARKGIAICSATRDGLCSVCHVRLRPHVFQHVRQNDAIIQCESCQRILYYAPPPPAAASTAATPAS
jgi:predicted  nucleic acid-binding Zn-ribbon protein